MKPLLARYRRVLAHLLPRAVVWATSLLAGLLMLVGAVVAGALLAVVVVVALVWWRLIDVRADRQLVARALLAIVAATTIAATSTWTPALLGCIVLVLAALMVESVADYATRAPLTAANLPGLATPLPSRLPEPLFLCTSAAVAVLALGTLWRGPTAALLAAVIVLAGFVGAVVQLVLARKHAGERAIRTALAGFAPRYAVYYAGASTGMYQVRMWLPYLARTGEQGILIVRDSRSFRAAAREFDLPVVLARSLESLEYLLVPGLGAFFYVNNEARNAHGVRYTGISHVQLGHGDSDKPASYSATFGIFDKIFVAGEAAVDRFAQHGVLVPREKFVLVGRPQVEDIEVRAAGGRSVPDHPVVLYAPTWRGGLEDSKFGSLHHGEKIVSALMAGGATVWFRPHPYSARDAESRVLIGRIDALLAADGSRPHAGSADTASHTVYACMNASDAMVTDVSSLATDYLYSNKPLAITDTGSVKDLEAAFPVARAAVQLPVTGDLAAPLADLLGADSHRADRERVRAYYLGDWPPAKYAEVFVDAARAAMLGRSGRS